ncbi:NINE protein [uncultured Desulfovibrio sp.]|uniref:NINE protein n=1 Tax=uncultured Desulfovibrio sp. TaxID=167968 RepID=UPI00260AAE28|nr:NINE protein [uncultured Desulfovibrio sp.]
MNNWHPLRLAALICNGIGTLLCFMDLLQEIRTFLAFSTFGIHSSQITALIFCILPTGLGITTVALNLLKDDSRKLTIILSFAAAVVIALLYILKPGSMLGFAFMLFLAAGVLLIVWPQIAMPTVGQLLQQRPKPHAPVAATAPAMQPGTAGTAEAGAAAAEPVGGGETPPHTDGTAQATARVPAIICPSCRNTVSSQARQCPHCGQPFRNEQASRRSRLVALLFCLFLGYLGIHRFYVGKFGTGILQLLTLGGLCIWTFIDCIFIACGAFRDAEGKQLTEWTVQ